PARGCPRPSFLLASTLLDTRTMDPFIDRRQYRHMSMSSVIMEPMRLDLIVTPTSPACCPPAAGSAMTTEDAEQTARTLKALADPARLRLLSIIAAHEGGETCVCDLTEPLGLSQPTVSHHLRVLSEAGLVTRD